MKKLIVDIESGGFKSGEMLVFAGRQTGKSMLTMHLLKDRWSQKNFYYTANNLNNLCKEIMLPESKYKFSRAKWYTAEMPGYATWRFSDEYNQIIAWCTEHFGAHPNKHDAWSRWYVGLGYINFRDEKDYMLYQLRWTA